MRRIVCGLPRSRTAWFSVWLSAHGCPAIHEMLSKVEDYDDYLRMLDLYADCCTYAQHVYLEVDRRVIIERDPAQVHASLDFIGIDFSEAELADDLEMLRALPGMRVPFDAIDASLEDIHAYLQLPVPFDAGVTLSLRELNVQMELDPFEARQDLMIKNYHEAVSRSYS